MDLKNKFILDACCGGRMMWFNKKHPNVLYIDNRKEEKGFLKQRPNFDGLEIEWKDMNFVNPPYGTEIGRWMEKGYKESLKGKLIIFLIPSRTDTRWWHNFVMKANEIYLIKGRLCFDDSKKTAPFPSCLVIFNRGEKSELKVFPLEFKKEEES